MIQTPLSFEVQIVMKALVKVMVGLRVMVLGSRWCAR